MSDEPKLSADSERLILDAARAAFDAGLAYYDVGKTDYRPGPKDAADSALSAHVAQLEKRLSEWEERETACCPEDVGFDGVIKSLRAKVAQLEWPFTWDDVDFLRGRSPTFEPERFLNTLADLIALRLPPREAR